MEETKNFTVTTNDASETIYVAEEPPAQAKATTTKAIKGGTDNAPVIP